MKRGEVWQVNLDPTIGAEINKIRPCVIVSKDALAVLPLKIVVPLTAWNVRFKNAPWHVKVESTKANGLRKASSADTFQVRSVSEKRLVEKLGVISPPDMEKVSLALALSLAID